MFLKSLWKGLCLKILHFSNKPYSKIKTIFNIELVFSNIPFTENKISANLVSILVFLDFVGRNTSNLNHNILVYSGIIIYF